MESSGKAGSHSNSIDKNRWVVNYGSVNRDSKESTYLMSIQCGLIREKVSEVTSFIFFLCCLVWVLVLLLSEFLIH